MIEIEGEIFVKDTIVITGMNETEAPKESITNLNVIQDMIEIEKEIEEPIEIETMRKGIEMIEEDERDLQEDVIDLIHHIAVIGIGNARQTGIHNAFTYRVTTCLLLAGVVYLFRDFVNMCKQISF